MRVVKYSILEGTYTFCDKYSILTHFTQTASLSYVLVINKFRVNFDKTVHLAKGDFLREFCLKSITISAGITIRNFKWIFKIPQQIMDLSVLTRSIDLSRYLCWFFPGVVSIWMPGCLKNASSHSLSHLNGSFFGCPLFLNGMRRLKLLPNDSAMVQNSSQLIQRTTFENVWNDKNIRKMSL